MSKVTDHLNSASELRSLAVSLVARNEDPERIEVRQEVRTLELFADWHHSQAQHAARWLFGDHRWPIAPEREADWFAGRYGLAHYYVSDEDRCEIDPQFRSWGKFDSQFAELVWNWSLDSSEPSLLDSEDEYASPVTIGTLDLLAAFPVVCEEFAGSWLPAAAIVWTASSGAVTVDYFETVAEMEAECEAIRSRVAEAADHACEDGSCEPCDEDPQCEHRYSCEHSAHECYRADWLPSIGDRPAKPAAGSTLAEELRDAERFADAFEATTSTKENN